MLLNLPSRARPEDIQEPALPSIDPAYLLTYLICPVRFTYLPARPSGQPRATPSTLPPVPHTRRCRSPPRRSPFAALHSPSQEPSALRVI